MNRIHQSHSGQRRCPERGDAGDDERNRKESRRFGSADVQSRNAGDPGHETGRLDRIPSPVPAPAEFGVSPASAGQQSAGQRRQRKCEGDGRHPRATPADGGGRGEQSRNQESDQSAVEKRRVPHHRRVLENGLETEAVDRRCIQPFERRGGQGHDEPERGGDTCSEAEGPIPVFPTRQSDRDDGGPAHQHGEQQQRAFRAGPHPGEAKEDREARTGVIGDVPQRPIVPGERQAEPDQGRGAEHKRRNEGSERDRGRTRGHAWNEGGHRGKGGEESAHPQCSEAEGHRTIIAEVGAGRASSEAPSRSENHSTFIAPDRDRL